MDAPRLVTLLQLSDTAFPTGTFAHSMGLEAAHEAGRLQDAGSLEKVVAKQLGSAATSDCVALRGSYAAAQIGSLEDVRRIDAMLTATRLTRETRGASAATGRRFLGSVLALGLHNDFLQEFHAVAKSGETAGNIAVAHGVAGATMDIGVEDVVVTYLYTVAASLVAAGQKIIPLGGGASQRVLYDLQVEIVSAAARSKCVSVEEMHSFTPLMDIHSMSHEDQRTRLYIS